MKLYRTQLVHFHGHDGAERAGRFIREVGGEDAAEIVSIKPRKTSVRMKRDVEMRAVLPVIVPFESAA